MDTVTPEERSRIMSRIRSPSQLEEKARPLVHRRYGPFVEHQARIEGIVHADFYDPQSRTVVFVNGCFWHGCETHFRPPKTRTDYWTAKVRRNMERDLDTWKWCLQNGYRVDVIWEHDLDTLLSGLPGTIPRRTQDPYPDTGESGETYDKEMENMEP